MMSATSTRSRTRYVRKPSASVRNQEPEDDSTDSEPEENEGRNEGGGNGGQGGDPEGGDGGGDGGGNGNGPNPNPPNPAFSLTPGRANHGVLDYSTKAGYYHWSGATKKLEEELYDCTPDGFYQFLKSLKKRSESYGWTNKEEGIFWVKPNTKRNTQKQNLLEDYGIFELERVQAHELTYINSPTRAAQDDRMLYECLMNSLTIEGKSKLNIHEAQYTIGNPKIPSGLCLFKVLVRESHLDSNATASMIRTQLTNLDTYISQIGNDIVKFNGHVQMLLDSLTARGETTHDLLTNLFRAYAACSDGNFVKYIGDRQSEWEDGAHLTAADLMEKAALRYKILKSKDIWEAPSPEEEKLLALEAKVSEMKKKLLKRKTDDADPEKPKKKKSSRQPKHEKKPDWMFKQPAANELTKPKQWNGAEWYFCGKATGGKCEPGQYRRHKPSECKGSSKPAKQTQRDFSNRNSDEKKKVTIKESIDELAGGYESS